MFQVYFEYTKKMFQMLNFDVKEIVVVTGTRSESAHEQKGLQANMNALGSKMILEAVFGITEVTV